MPFYQSLPSSSAEFGRRIVGDPPALCDADVFEGGVETVVGRVSAGTRGVVPPPPAPSRRLREGGWSGSPWGRHPDLRPPAGVALGLALRRRIVAGFARVPRASPLGPLGLRPVVGAQALRNGQRLCLLECKLAIDRGVAAPSRVGSQPSRRGIRRKRRSPRGCRPGPKPCSPRHNRSWFATICRRRCRASRYADGPWHTARAGRAWPRHYSGGRPAGARRMAAFNASRASSIRPMS